MTILNACIGLVGKICLKPREKGMGFRKIDAFNYVLLAARVTKPNSFMDRVMKSKYFSYCNFLGTSLYCGVPYIWRSIRESKALLLKGYSGGWVVGNKLGMG